MNMDNPKDMEKLRKDVLGKGGVLANLYFDIHANRRDTVEQLGTVLVQKILGEDGVVYAVGEIDEPKENNGLLSSPVDVKVLARNLATLVKVCGNYSPFSVEIVEPEEIKLSVSSAQELLMSVAVNNYELKKMMIEKVYTKEDLEKFRKAFDARMEMAKKAIEKR